MLTLRRLLDQPDLELTLLVDGDDGALDRELLWLHNTELPDPSPYVRPGELVLTNGVWLDQTDPGAFVTAVRRAQAAGIVFGLREESPETPPALIGACRSARLPLAEISITVPFTAVTRAAAGVLAEGRQRELSGALRRGGALASAISSGAGASGILDVVRREHDLPLVVVDRTGRQLAVAGVGISDDQARTVALSLKRHPPPLEIELDDSSAALFLVAAVGEVDAALVCLRSFASLSQAEVDSLEQAATYLSLEVAKRQAVQAIEQRFAGEVLDMVQAGASRERDVADRLRAFGVDPSGPVAVVAIACASQAADVVGDLADAVTTLLLDQGLAALVAPGSREVVALIAWPQLAGRSLRTVAEELQVAGAKALPGERVLVGVGGVVTTVPALRELLVQARETCRALRLQAGGPTVSSFSEVDTYRLLLGMLDSETLTRFSKQILGLLRAHDRQHGGDLEATLRAFLEFDGQYAVAASHLHIHVNTLRNRLGRLTELTGRDVRRTSDRVDLFLALEADAIR